ncbi:unnamed protein product [Musa acuminata subsp. malaccensis]|uniref:(wild Malaysian banana) hypothetical protein n=1 Tax=Musa acuminata subsp. malaccensis TaxID=214687 RepID=A0A804JF41_MUSAM|nr:unnamed protein product [Musa acuminata subsp. malaccensis]
MHFHKSGDSMWLPCGPRHPGSIQTTLQELAAKGLAAKILPPPITKTRFRQNGASKYTLLLSKVHCWDLSHLCFKDQTLHLSFFLSFLCYHPLLHVSQCNAKTVFFVLLHKFV